MKLVPASSQHRDRTLSLPNEINRRNAINRLFTDSRVGEQPVYGLGVVLVIGRGEKEV